MPKRRTCLIEKLSEVRALVNSSSVTSMGTPLTMTLRERSVEIVNIWNSVLSVTRFFELAKSV